MMTQSQTMVCSLPFKLELNQDFHILIGKEQITVCGSVTQWQTLACD